MGLFVKICGIADREAGLAAAAAGADAVGFVFHPRSRRYVPPAAAGGIARALPEGVLRVGVFVDAPLERLREAAAAAGLDLLQLHGAETPAFCRRAREATGCGIIKALRVSGAGAPDLGPWRREAGAADWFLLDAWDPDLPGGTGRAFDWAGARDLGLPAPVLLAGGLTPENVAAALDAARPAGVDVSTGVETDGRKDPDKIRRFVAGVRRWEDASRRVGARP